MKLKIRNEAENESYPHLQQLGSLPGWQQLLGMKTGKCLLLGEGRHLTSLPRLQPTAEKPPAGPPPAGGSLAMAMLGGYGSSSDDSDA